MNAEQSLLDELENGLANRDAAQWAEKLWGVTDLFVAGSHELSNEQIALFDDILCRLLDQIEMSARVAFGRRLATISAAPPRIVRALAFDDAIDVAGPVLSQSDRLDDTSLVENAKTKSQAHLLAISRRKTIAEAVTDVLIERGDGQVGLSVARNAGAKFSAFGHLKLVQRSRHDRNLALSVWARLDIPRQHLLQLFVDASGAVRQQFETADRRKAVFVRAVIAEASNQIQGITREKSATFEQAACHVRSLEQSGELDEAHLAAFAGAGKFDETAVALSIMCELPIEVIVRLMVQSRSEQMLVLAKAIGLSWATTKAILALEAGTRPVSTRELDQYFANFMRLRPETANQAIRFYRSRQRAAASSGA